MPKERVPNQRAIQVVKEPADKNHLYTANNLAAIDEAARYLQSKAGFKLYFYIAKNQNKYEFLLSSKHFCEWAGVGITAYTSAFEELEKNGYLFLKEGTKDDYIFYDKSQLNLEQEHKEEVKIEYHNTAPFEF